MNTHNVKTAAQESSERWVKGLKIDGITAGLSVELDYLINLRVTRMTVDDRAELLLGTLINIAAKMCDSVVDWTNPRPVLPLSSVKGWIKAREITLAMFGELGKAAWDHACERLKTDLSAGYAMWRDDIA